MANILVIDDELSIRKTFYALLRQEGHQVVCAENSDIGLQKLQQMDFDLVITDIFLPGTNGNEIISKIGTENPDLSIIMMTGAPQIETVIDGIRAGASDYLTKPVNKDSLLRAVSRTIKQKSLQDLNKRLTEENLVYQNHLESLVIKKTDSLSSLLRRIIEVQDIERSTLGHRIHEFLYQQIKTLQMDLQNLDTSEIPQEKIDSIAKILLETENAAYNLSKNLNPVSLKQSGISKAVLSLAESLFPEGSIEYTINLENTDARFSEGWDLHLYKIIEEIITNCISHSDAKTFLLTDSASTAEQLVITARDDGKSVPESIISGKSDKLGLFVLHERVRIIDGNIKYTTGEGTTITLTFPLRTRRDA